MIQQKPDRFLAWHDKRPWTVIRADEDYFENFYIWKNGERPAQSNVVNIKEAAHG